MKPLLPLLIFFTSAVATDSGCPSNSVWPEGCHVDVTNALCQIDCTKTANKAACSNQCETEVGVGSDDITYEGMSEVKCRELCEASMKDATSDDDRCRFWRYEKDHPEEDKHCNLLKTCDVFSPCEDDCQCGDVGCQDGPADDQQPCAGGTEFHPSSAPENKKTTYIRWDCDTSANPYASDPIPANTVCFTNHKCSLWDAASPTNPQIQVMCEGTSGHWKDAIGVPADLEDVYAEALGDQTPGSVALTELKCDPDDVNDVRTVNSKALEELGGLIRCENPDENQQLHSDQYVISAPNTCILLCDFQLGMTIEAKLNKDGAYEFKIVETDDIIAQGEEDTKIKCW